MKKLITLLLLGIMIAGQAQTPYDPYQNETKAQKDERMAWWRDAKFGMFIHWGVYAVPAGTYNGKQIDGIGEWIMLRGQIPVDDYMAYAKEFNPVKYNPEEWAKLAKKAGMRYMVITSKHHDGFALFPSQVTDWDVVDATPYGKDLIGPLAKAAREEGLKFGLYYSQAQDWIHPGGAKSRYEEETGWDEKHYGDFDKYLEEIAAPQVGEILSCYRPDVLWWDTPRWMNQERAETLIPLIRIVPGIITNNRLGGDYNGDTETPEQHIPATGIEDRDWEVCMTMNRTWGYKSYDHDWKSTEDLIQKLCDIASKGGNFLLNVGPTAEGLIPQESIDRLEEIGAWMDINGEAIYGTTASPFSRLTWGRCTKKITPDGAVLYLHVFDWPENGKLVLEGLKSNPSSIKLLQGGEELKWKALKGDTPGITITVPKVAPDAISTVIKLEIDGALEVESMLPGQDKNGNLVLEPEYADLHNRLGTNLSLEQKKGKTNIGNWTDARTWISYTFEIDQPGTFNLQAGMAGEEATGINLKLGDQPGMDVQLTPSGSYSDFQVVDLGTVTIEEPGTYTIEIRAISEGWSPVNLRTVSFKPVN
ncbi:MAG: alpha-L-fucosidase [Bacteroidales bacterium]|nr:alpha-L-fucosidase [Bacteroidales bacterium]